MRSLQPLLFTFLVHLSTPTTVTWMRNAVFNLPQNFVGGKLPCSKQTVLFPEELQEPIRLVGNVSVSEIILPNDGELYLDDVIIALGVDAEEQCEDDRQVEFKDVSYSSWEDPDVWYSEKFNEATPDAERVPCHEDIVLFPKNTQIDIELPKDTQYINMMIIGDTEVLDVDSLRANFSFDFILNDYWETGLAFVNTKCSSKAGCPCQINTPEIKCYKKNCPEPKCLYPIQPTGHCCKICGGSITFETTPSFNMVAFKETVDKIVGSYNRDQFVYHVSKLPQTWESFIDSTEREARNKFNDISGKVHVIVVEKGEYTGVSTEVINELYHSMSRMESKKLFLSGNPINMVGFGWKVFISALLIVMGIMGVIYVYYYRLPDHWIRNFSLNMSIPGRPVLSRFQRRTDSVLSLARRDSEVSRISTGGFRNPMYDSKRGRVVVTESVEEEE
ncbi:protein amnionless [Amyelois transitella]|uniref:protein amnionless n=1 Tax=Amyelois transitella TaxID=680683 RepID=UPI00067B2236|nr:protein amnionless [Amyelois transitella]